jgi:hypothetical protein
VSSWVWRDDSVRRGTEDDRTDLLIAAFWPCSCPACSFFADNLASLHWNGETLSGGAENDPQPECDYVARNEDTPC